MTPRVAVASSTSAHKCLYRFNSNLSLPAETLRLYENKLRTHQPTRPNCPYIYPAVTGWWGDIYHITVAAKEFPDEEFQLPPVHARQIFGLLLQVINVPLVDKCSGPRVSRHTRSMLGEVK